MNREYSWKLSAIVVGVLLGVLLAHIALFDPPAFAADSQAQAIVGIWKLASYTREEVDTGKKLDLYGPHPGGYYSFSTNGRFIGMLIGDNQKAPAGAVFTDQERVELFKNILSAYSGTYTVEGDKIVIAVDFSWNQIWTGTKQTRNFKIEGKQLKIWNPPRKSTVDGKAISSTLIFEKVE